MLPLRDGLPERVDVVGDGDLTTDLLRGLNPYGKADFSYQSGNTTGTWIMECPFFDFYLDEGSATGLSCSALKGWEFSLEAYWKELYNVLEYKDGREALSGTGNWEDNVEVGRGRSKGIEAYVSKTSGRATGSFAYTLSKTDRWFPDGTINDGRVFPFKYDRRHVLNVNFSYKLNEKLDFGAAWSYMSGYNITVPTRKTEIEGPDGSQLVIDYVPSRNAYTTPSSHHLDLRLNLHKPHRRGEGIWNFTVYNIYNAMNPDWVMYEDLRGDMDDSGERYIPSISVRTFLTILPSFSYTYKF